LIGEEKEEEKDEEADGAVVWLREGVRGPWEPLFPIFDLSFKLLPPNYPAKNHPNISKKVCLGKFS